MLDWLGNNLREGYRTGGLMGVGKAMANSFIQGAAKATKGILGMAQYLPLSPLATAATTAGSIVGDAIGLDDYASGKKQLL